MAESIRELSVEFCLTHVREHTHDRDHEDDEKDMIYNGTQSQVVFLWARRPDRRFKELIAFDRVDDLSAGEKRCGLKLSTGDECWPLRAWSAEQQRFVRDGDGKNTKVWIGLSGDEEDLVEVKV